MAVVVLGFLAGESSSPSRGSMRRHFADLQKVRQKRQRKEKRGMGYSTTTSSALLGAGRSRPANEA